MVTLPQSILDFNRQIKLTNNGAHYLNTGRFLFQEFEEKIVFSYV